MLGRNPDSLGLSEDSDDLGVQICNDVHVTSVGAGVPVTQSNKLHTFPPLLLLFTKHIVFYCIHL